MRAVHPNDLSSQPVGSVLNISQTTRDPDEPSTIEKILICALYTGTLVLFPIWVIFFVVRGYIVANVRDPTLEINSLTLSNFYLSSRPNQISANWNVQMNFKTVDKHRYFNLTNVKVLVYYNDKIVGVTNLASFYVSPKKPPMQFGGAFYSRLSGDYIDDSMISHIVQGMNITGTLKFNVELLASMKKTYKGWGTESWDPYLWVYRCEEVELMFKSLNASEAHMLKGFQECKKAVYAPFEYKMS